jgi:hypothetical protein
MTLPHFNLRSKALRNGMLDGFTAYYHFFGEQSYPRARSIDTSIRGVWLRVGLALNEADIFERSELVKTARKSNKKQTPTV